MVWTGSSPLWGPTIGRFYVIYALIVEQGLVLFIYLFISVHVWLGHVGPFCCNLGMSNVLYTFIPNEVLIIEVIQFLGCYT